MPYALAFGGKELQLETYLSILNIANKDVRKMDFWEKNSTHPQAIHHLFGSGKWYHSVVSQIHSNYYPSRIIVSPNFYFLPSAKLLLASKVSKLTPFKNDFHFKEYIFRKSDIIVANSLAEKELIASLFGRRLFPKIKVIPNVIPDNFTYIAQEIDVCKRFNIKSGFILSVGLLDERKNSVNMLKAFLKSFKNTNRQLVVVGKYRFTNIKNYHEAKSIIESNSDKIIHITDALPNSDLIKSLYKNCDIHYLPSHVETPGISNLEALAFGKKLVLGDCPPVKEYFREYAGYCDSFSLDSIASALESSIGKTQLPNAQQYIADNFLVSTISKPVLSLYEL